jgi:hypothetical protein
MVQCNWALVKENTKGQDEEKLEALNKMFDLQP